MNGTPGWLRAQSRDFSLRRISARIADGSTRKVIVIAHSMGGLVARWWLTALGGHRVCRALITVGTPHRGAPKSVDWVVNGVRLGHGIVMKGVNDIPTVAATTLARFARRVAVFGMSAHKLTFYFVGHAMITLTDLGLLLLPGCTKNFRCPMLMHDTERCSAELTNLVVGVLRIRSLD